MFLYLTKFFPLLNDTGYEKNETAQAEKNTDVQKILFCLATSDFTRWLDFWKNNLSLDSLQ